MTLSHLLKRPGSIVQRSLTMRYMLITLASFGVMMSVIMYLQASMTKADMEEAQREKIERLGMLIAAASGEPILSYNFIAIESFATEVRKDVDVVDVVFADKEGKRLNVAMSADSLTPAERTFGREHIRTAETRAFSFPISVDGTTLGSLTLTVHALGSDERTASIRTRLMVMNIVGVCIVVLLLVYVTKTAVIRPVLGMIGAIDTADLNSQLHSTRADEIGTLQRSFDKFVVSIRETLLQVAEAASTVARSTGDITSRTEEMAAAAQEQSSQAGEVAGAVEEMTKTIVENSRNALTTADTAREARKVAEQGGTVVGESVQGMKKIAEVVNHSAATVQELGRSSDQIGEIIGVIDDIADQTNLLALNAAIEAARAGDQGRGFAVVADEVRKLAERTTKATTEIAGMIRKIQQETANAVESMQKGTSQVGEGISLADNAGKSLRNIVDISQKVTDMVAQIAAASEEQSSASEQISKNVEAISSVTHESMTAIQQIARSAEDLNRLTEHLEQTLSRFHLSKGTREPRAESSSPDDASGIFVHANGTLSGHS